MPSVSVKQHNFMEAVAHSPKFAREAGVPQSVGADFAAADQGKTFKPKTTKTPVKVKAPRVKKVRVKAPQVSAPHVSYKSPAAQLLGLVRSPHPLLSGR